LAPKLPKEKRKPLNPQSEKWEIMTYQRTLKTAVSCTGIGLHSGREVSLTLRPADPDTGIVFVRKDLPGPVRIKAETAAISASAYAASLEKDGVSVGTVEHLLAAISGLDVDNVLVELDAPEVPIMDGSAAPFVALIREGGIVEQDRLKKYVFVREMVRMARGDRWIELWPSRGNLEISYTVDFEHPLISKQFYHVSCPGRAFEVEISPARTFGFLSDVTQLRLRGFARGGSLENAIVVDDYGVLNEEGLRFPDEFVRHKVLDLIGDLSLLGYPLVCHVVAYKSGHTMNHNLLRELLSRKECWELAESTEKGGEVIPAVEVAPRESRERLSA